MTFDIVIPVRNGAGYLRNTLPAALATGVRCIVVDDASSDASSAAAAELGATVLRLTERRGAAAARNAGAALSQADVVLFLDADVSVHDDTVSRMRAHFEAATPPDAVIGRYDEEPADPGFISVYRNLLHSYTHAIAHKSASTFWTGCGAILRRRFVELGGFNERRSMDDIDLGYRLTDAGGKIILDPEIQVKHWKRWTFWRMIAVDIFARGVPWAELMLERGHIDNDLNVRASQRACVALAWSGACVAPAWPIAALGSWIAAVALNLPFYAFLARRRGFAFAVACIPAHLLYHFYNGLSFGIASVRCAVGIRPAPMRKTEYHGSP